MELAREEEDALRGEHGEVQQLAYRILVATGEATDAERLAPIRWAHLSGVNYNTIGDAGERFLSDLSGKPGARVRVQTTLNPMGFDADTVSDHGLNADFVSKQNSIRDSYERMGVIPSFSCVPYDIFPVPEPGTRVAFAESNAAIHANSIDGLRTNKESAFSALASALTGKSPLPAAGRGPAGDPDIAIRMEVDEPDELACGMLGFFAGKVGGDSVAVSGITGHGQAQLQVALRRGWGHRAPAPGSSSGMAPPGTERVDFGKREMQEVYDELNTAEKGDLITLGSPQLGLAEIRDLSLMLKGRSFSKRCMVFCPRTVREQARELGYTSEIGRAGAEILSDCCTCLTPLIDPDKVDAVTTNSIKGGYYLKNSTGVGVDLRPLSRIIADETR